MFSLNTFLMLLITENNPEAEASDVFEKGLFVFQ